MNNNLIEKTISNVLEDVSKKLPNHEAINYTDRDYKRTYSEFNYDCDQIAKAFLKIGIKKGDHVAIWASNIPEWLITLFACSKIGAVLVTVNTAYKIFEIEYLLRQSDSMTLILMEGFKDINYMQIINELCPTLKNSEPGKLNVKKLPFLKNIVYCGNKAYPGVYNFQDLYKLADYIDDNDFINVKKQVSPFDIANMQYTSGTTGFPKGVMLTHYNIINDGNAIGDCMKFTKDDKLLITVPFFHCFGLVLAVMACLTHSSSMVPIDIFSPQKVLSAIESEKCTAIHGVPTMFIAMLNQKNFYNFDLSTLRTGIMAGSPCPINVMRKVIDDMGVKEITIAYGQTEASPVCTQTTTDDSIETRVTTVGKALPFIECKIVDPETGRDLPINTPGEFCARGYNIMKGYYKMPEATAQVIDEDGWLHTGDLAVMDERGYYKITGRIKDMIIRGGENIYPKEIEEFLYTLDQVKDAQVIGVPSESYGEEICACILLNDGVSIDEDYIKNAVKANMAKHKVPSFVWFMNEFPMTASGKIQKFKLREQAIEKFNLQSAQNIETA